MRLEEKLAGSRRPKKEDFKYIAATAQLAFTSYTRRRKGLRFGERLEVCLAVLLMLAVVLEFNARNLGISSGNLLRLMVEGQRTLIYYKLILLALFAVLSSLYVSAKTYCTGIITRILRMSLTEALNDKYFGVDSYYRLNRLVDNPDQRITVDVQEFCLLLVLTIDKFILSPVTVFVYSKDTYDSNGFMALVIVYSFFGLGVVLQRLIMPGLVRNTVLLDRLEGDFRFSHATIRNNAEPIFLSKTGERFRSDVEASFERIFIQSPIVLGMQFFMNVIGNFFAYVGGVANYVIIYWTTDFTQYTAAELSEFISQGSFKTLYLISKLTEFVQIATHLSDMTAHARRIREFVKLADEGENYIRQWESAADRELTIPTIVFSDVDIISPDEQCHIREFDLRIIKGEHVYITGPNGSGKTSLVRVLTRLWQPTRGRVLVLGGATIACAPQETASYSGTLLEQLGLTNDPVNDDEACRTLMAVKLASLPLRTGGMRRTWPRSRWLEMLSPGELQRLVLARLLLALPSFAILDEATSAVDQTTERAIYEEFWRRGITTITIGHRMEPSLMEKISIFVTLDGKGGHVIHRQGEELLFDSKRRII